MNTRAFILLASVFAIACSLDSPPSLNTSLFPAITFVGNKIPVCVSLSSLQPNASLPCFNQPILVSVRLLDVLDQEVRAHIIPDSSVAALPVDGYDSVFRAGARVGEACFSAFPLEQRDRVRAIVAIEQLSDACFSHCSDGNLNPGDGCDALGNVENGRQCDTIIPAPVRINRNYSDLPRFHDCSGCAFPITPPDSSQECFRRIPLQSVQAASGTPHVDGGVTFGPENLFDGDTQSIWNPQGEPSWATYELNFTTTTPITMNALAIKGLGDSVHDVQTMVVCSQDSTCLSSSFPTGKDSFLPWVLPHSVYGNSWTFRFAVVTSYQPFLSEILYRG